MRWIDLFVEGGTIPSELYHAVDRFAWCRTRRVLKYLNMRWTSTLDLCMLVYYIFMLALLLHLLLNVDYHEDRSWSCTRASCPGKD
jgi:hypothetical protein